MSAPAMRTAAPSGHLVLEALSKRYPGLVAVDAIDLEVKSGEFITLLGPSGSGKTTTLMMIAGFTAPTAGEIRIDGRPVTRLPPERRNIGVVFQNYALFPHMTVAENIGFPLRMRGCKRGEIRERTAAALELVRLGGLGERRPSQLSGGQQQRVAVARALVFEPQLLLMDEPLGALDKQLREQMQFELRRLHRELGVTIVYVTHDQEEALTMSDRVAIMRGGRIEQLGTASAIYERPANRFVAEFIGESNVVQGKLQLGDGAAAFVSDHGWRMAVAEPGPASPARSSLLILRPEKISLAPATERSPLVGAIAELIYVGDFNRYRVQIPGATLTVKVPNNRTAFQGGVGDRVEVHCDPNDACIVPADSV